MAERTPKSNKGNPNPLAARLARISRKPDETDTALFDRVAVLSMRYAVREIPVPLFPRLEDIFDGRWAFREEEGEILGQRTLHGEDPTDIQLRGFSERPRRTVIVESHAISMLVQRALLGADLQAAIDMEEGLTSGGPLMARAGLRYETLLNIIAKNDVGIVGPGTQLIERPDLQNVPDATRQKRTVS